MASLIPAEVMAQMYLAKAMPNLTGMGPTGFTGAGPPQMGQLQRAHALAAGQPSMGQMSRTQGPGGQGPMARQLGKAKQAMLSAALIDESDHDKFKEAVGNDEITAPMFQKLIEMRQQHHAAKQSAVTAEDLAGGRASDQASPGTIAGPRGRGVLQPNAATMPQQAANPMVGLINAHKHHFPDSQIDQIAQMPGMTPQQIIQYMRQEQQTAQTAGRQQATEQRQEERETRREGRQDARHQQDLQLRQLQHQQAQAQQVGDEATVARLQQQIEGAMKPQQQPAGGQLPQSQQYQVGQTITNSKGESAMIVGYDHDGHPLVQRAGR